MHLEISRIRLGRRSPDELARLLDAARAAELSYDHRGSTFRDGAPPGLRDRVFERSAIGSLAQAAAALRAWAAHRGIDARIVPGDAPIEEGTSLLVVAPFGPFEMAVPNRIVQVVDEPERFGFAYGTLVGHAEAGEERFLAEVVGPGRLRLTIRAHARPASAPARAGGPVVRRLQDAAATRYLQAWAEVISR